MIVAGQCGITGLKVVVTQRLVPTNAQGGTVRRPRIRDPCLLAGGANHESSPCSSNCVSEVSEHVSVAKHGTSYKR